MVKLIKMVLCNPSNALFSFEKAEMGDDNDNMTKVAMRDDEK